MQKNDVILRVFRKILWPCLPVLLLALTPISDDAWGASGKPAGKGDLAIATFYAKHFAGRRTASGAVYRHEKFTAAHPHLPFGTRVRVVNPVNGREVTVTVNDRCRAQKKTTIDLSRAAAQELGILGRGAGKVRIAPIDKES
ncbi:septal ring lytic transglycosylase RlpA family protein [Trichloromonas sp.]|uniref:septal ring lytic transglycosylase RlpA family protein n=1 Tax=Trichloromonas sp. TaxID=3069249 RepID=UPI002A4DD6EC|nr:septal ring lytic transglycosylase RlpA family protein [Trichloromonas sp.]